MTTAIGSRCGVCGHRMTIKPEPGWPVRCSNCGATNKVKPNDNSPTDGKATA